jgi:diamine N-acetyltransferase
MKRPFKNNARIEKAGETDLPALSQLAAVIWRACYPGIITMEQIDYMLEWMYSPDSLRDELQHGVVFYRLLVDGQFSGFSSFGPTQQPNCFKLHKLYLLPRLHGHGYGSLLLDHCEHEVRKLGGRRLTLNVNKRNEKAIKAYQRNGYSIASHEVADIGRSFFMDDYVMAKELAPVPKDSAHTVL